MAFSFVCSACGKRLSIPPPLYEKKIRGHVVTIGCKVCGADISVDATDLDSAPVVSVAPPPRSVVSPVAPAESAAPQDQAAAAAARAEPDRATPPPAAPTGSSDGEQRSSRSAVDPPVAKPPVAAPRPLRRAAREPPPERETVSSQQPRHIAKGPPPAPNRPAPGLPTGSAQPKTAVDRPTPIVKKPESPPRHPPVRAPLAGTKGQDADVWHAVTEQREPAPPPSPRAAGDLPRQAPELPKDPSPTGQAQPAVPVGGEVATSGNAAAAESAPLVAQSADDSAPAPEQASSSSPGPSAPIEPIPAAVFPVAEARHGVHVRSVWRSWKSPFALGFLLILAAAAVMVAALPRRGTVSISATGPGGESLHVAEVIVDEKVRCNGLPCRVTDLAPTDHVIRVVTSEYGSAERVVGVRRGRDQSVDFPAPSGTAAPHARPAEPMAEKTGQAPETKGSGPAAVGRSLPAPKVE
jgi:hypothetical protein